MEKVLFAESFGTKAIGTDNIPKYDKSGLTTFYPEDKNNYSYGPGNNASIQTAPYTYTTQTTSGAYVRFPKNNSMMAIKGINLHGAKSLRFSYCKATRGVYDIAIGRYEQAQKRGNSMKL